MVARRAFIPFIGYFPDTGTLSLTVKVILPLLILTSCTSLESSKMDRKMRFQGSFSCNPVSEEKPGAKETLAEADAARVRCAKDEWKINQDELVFTRTLFQSKNCDTVLGQIKFTEHFSNQGDSLNGGSPRCKMIRISPSWLGEESGKCMVKDLKLNTPYALASVYHCKGYVPSFCARSVQAITVSPEDPEKDSHASYDHLIFSAEPSSASMSCKRYAAE